MRFDEVMGLTVNGARKLFGDGPAARRGLGSLVRLWHPDVCAHPRAAEALAHITAIRDAVSGGSSPRPAREFVRVDGSRFALRPISSFYDGSAEVLVCERSVSRLFSPDEAYLARAELVAVRGFRFGGDAMERQMRRFLPTEPRVTELMDGGFLHTVPRREDQVMLADLIRVKGPFCPRTAAWVISGLLNIACWLEWAGLLHGAVSPETVMVSPERHETALFGGWEFSTPMGERPIALPESTMRMFPGLASPKSATPPNMDLCLIRETAMRVFGVRDAGRLLDGSVPREIGSWITFPPPSGAVRDYENWRSALRTVFGEPKFIRMGVSPYDVYGIT